MSENPIKSRIQGHSSGNTEIWDVHLTHKDGRIAFVNGLNECKDARRAEEFLRLGFAAGWQMTPSCTSDMMVAGLEALQSERYIDEGDASSRLTVQAIWDAMTSEWTRHMLARIECGEEPGVAGAADEA